MGRRAGKATWGGTDGDGWNLYKVHPVAVRCDMVLLHQAFRARHVRKTGIRGEVRHGVTSGVSRETSKTTHVTPHLHREYHTNIVIRHDMANFGGTTCLTLLV